ncbi:MAG: CPBP family intramembrane metalloprotease [Acidobacteria bacterium]|nr:CPBP family intramembrane metalloprotease [Acidobacteriota bacterium]
MFSDIPKASAPVEPVLPALSPDSPRWNWGIALLVWGASVGAILFIRLMVFLPAAFYFGVDLGDNQASADFATNDPRGVIAQLVGTIPAHIATLILAFVIVTRFGKDKFRDALGWSGAGVKTWHYIAMTLGFWVLAIAIFSIFPEQEDNITRTIRSSRTALYLLSAIAVLSAPIVEEVVYRGIVYSAFLKRFGMPIAIAVAATLFTLVHVPQYFENPAKIALLLGLSLVLTLLRAGTGSLWPPVVLHTLINFSQTALLIAEPYLKSFLNIPDAVNGFLK